METKLGCDFSATCFMGHTHDDHHTNEGLFDVYVKATGTYTLMIITQMKTFPLLSCGNHCMS